LPARIASSVVSFSLHFANGLLADALFSKTNPILGIPKLIFVSGSRSAGAAPMANPATKTMPMPIAHKEARPILNILCLYGGRTGDASRACRFWKVAVRCRFYIYDLPRRHRLRILLQSLWRWRRSAINVLEAYVRGSGASK